MNIPFPTFKLLNQKSTWFKIFLIALGTAFLIAAWPTAKCAVADCKPRDKWCGNCAAKHCNPHSGIREIRYTSPIYFDSQGRPFCGYVPFRNIGTRCQDSNTCNVTKVSGRSVWRSGGYSYTWVHDQRVPNGCTSRSNCPYFNCTPKAIVVRVDCCAGGGAGGGNDPGGGGCTPEYDEPSLTLSSLTPPYPLTIGQDPEEEGFDLVVSAQGGEKTNSCAEGPDRAPLSSLTVRSVTLANQSIAWIEEELSAAYPNAHVLGSYPLIPSAATDINGASGTITIHVDPQDPGVYEIAVEAQQERGDDDTYTETFLAQVWLLEGTIWGGGE